MNKDLVNCGIISSCLVNMDLEFLKNKRKKLGHIYIKKKRQKCQICLKNKLTFWEVFLNLSGVNTKRSILRYIAVKVLTSKEENLK